MINVSFAIGREKVFVEDPSSNEVCKFSDCRGSSENACVRVGPIRLYKCNDLHLVKPILACSNQSHSIKGYLSTSQNVQCPSQNLSPSLHIWKCTMPVSQSKPIFAHLKMYNDYHPIEAYLCTSKNGHWLSSNLSLSFLFCYECQQVIEEKMKHIYCEFHEYRGNSDWNMGKQPYHSHWYIV